jgi:hypothetical protein
MANQNPGPAVAGIPNTELYVSTGPLQRVIYPVGFTNGAAIGNGTLSFQYFSPQYPITATRLDLLLNQLIATAGTTATAAALYTAIGGVYSTFLSTGTGANTTGLTLLSGGSQTASFTWASNSAGNTNLSVSAIRPISVPINLNVSPGEYFVAFAVSTSNSSVGLSTTALAWSLSIQQANTMQTAVNYAEPLAATTANSGLYGAMGEYSAATGGLPNSLPVTAINQTGAPALAGNFAFVMRNY